MSGVSIPQGMQGMWGGTGAPVGFGGGSSANTVEAVKDATGGLKAYDPTTMAGTTKAPTPEAPKFAAAGMDTTGLPSYVTNWLAQGGQGSMPTMSNTSGNPLGTGVTAAGIGAGGTQLAGKNTPTGDNDAAWRAAHKKEIDAAALASQPKPPTAAAGAPAAGQYTAIPFNAPGGYNPVGMQQSMAVSQQYNPATGQSTNIASPPVGGGSNAPQVMAMNGQIFTDGKGGYFNSDGKGGFTPVHENVLKTMTGIGQSMGYK